MYRLSILILTLAVAACQPTTSVQQQQRDFICQSLIEGYLKASGQQNFELWQKNDMQDSVIPQRLFSYQSGSTRTTLIGETPLKKLQFVCWNNAQHFAIAQHDQNRAPRQALLTVQLHLPKTTDTWQVSAPKTQ
mgnify:CR=1 FL=1